MQARSNLRFSIYSSAPPLQPSLADTSSNRSSSHLYSSRFSERTSLSQHTIPEKTSIITTSSISSTRTLPTGAAIDGMYNHVDADATGSSWTLSSTDSRTADLRSFAHVLDKMADARLENQRYVMSGNKTEEFSKIALGAKLDRALSRRMVGQDAVFSGTARRQQQQQQQHQQQQQQQQMTKKPQSTSVLDEKRALEVQAA